MDTYVSKMAQNNLLGDRVKFHINYINSYQYQFEVDVKYHCISYNLLSALKKIKSQVYFTMKNSIFMSKDLKNLWFPRKNLTKLVTLRHFFCP